MSQDFGLLLNVIFVSVLYLFIAFVAKRSFSALATDDTGGQDSFDDDFDENEDRTAASLVNSAGDIYELSSSNTLGRAENSDIVLENEYISHHHATIFQHNDSWYLKDEGSTNGTFLNGKQITDETRLKSGDIISIGQIALTFKE